MSSAPQFDWQKFLDVAQQLRTQSTEQALRSAISRAYYAAFGKAQEHLVSKGIRPPATGEAHRFVWQRFLDSRRECRELGVVGDRLFRKRKQADYDTASRDFVKDAEQAVLDAERFLTLLRERANLCF